MGLLLAKMMGYAVKRPDLRRLIANHPVNTYQETINFLNGIPELEGRIEKDLIAHCVCLESERLTLGGLYRMLEENMRKSSS